MAAGARIATEEATKASELDGPRQTKLTAGPVELLAFASIAE